MKIKNLKIKENSVKAVLFGMTVFALSGCASAEKHTVNLDVTSNQESYEHNKKTTKSIKKTIEENTKNNTNSSNAKTEDVITDEVKTNEVKTEEIETNDEVKEEKNVEENNSIKSATSATVEASKKYVVSTVEDQIKDAYKYAKSYVEDDGYALALLYAMNSDIAVIDEENKTVKIADIVMTKQNLADNIEDAILTIANYEAFGEEENGKGMKFDASKLVIVYDDKTKAQKIALSQLYEQRLDFYKNPTIDKFNKIIMTGRFGAVEKISYVDEYGKKQKSLIEKPAAEFIGRESSETFIKFAKNKTNVFENGKNQKFYDDAHLLAELSGFTIGQENIEAKCNKIVADEINNEYQKQLKK